MTGKEVLELAVQELTNTVNNTQHNPRQAPLNEIRKQHVKALSSALSVYPLDVPEVEANRSVAYELDLARAILNELKPGWNIISS